MLAAVAAPFAHPLKKAVANEASNSPAAPKAGNTPFHHLADGLFRNNYIEPAEQEKTFGEMMRWRREAPDVELLTFPTTTPDINFLQNNNTQPTLTWIGHASLLLQLSGANILTDPHFSERASPVGFAGPKRGTPAGIGVAQLPRIDVILISHNHYDHLDQSSIRQLVAAFPDAQYLVPLKLSPTLRHFGVRPRNIKEHDWGQASEFAATSTDSNSPAAPLRFIAEPCQHWSKRGFFDRNKTLWASWVIESPQLRFLFIGDTGYSQDFKDLANKYGGFDAAAIPIGAYEPRWFMKNSHINPQESVQIFKDLACRFAVATHWGSFILTDEPMDEPPKQLQKELTANAINPQQFAVFTQGEMRDLSFLL